MRQTAALHGEITVGDIIAERYRIVAELGRGAMGVVYEAEHITVGRRVAVKVLANDWKDNENISRRFRAEARAASAAGHPNIIEVLDAGDLDNGRPYLVMEFLEGSDLFDLVNAKGPLEARRACRIGLGIARAIDAAHGQGIVHRDLKLENVMVVTHGDQEVVKVLDFGIASDGAGPGHRATALGQVLGTPLAMAPEQSKGQRATPAFDIYAIGGILFELLTARAPFQSEELSDLLAQKVDRAAPSVTTLRTGLPASLSSLVDECLARSPDERPATAADIAHRLEAILDELEARGSAPVGASVGGQDGERSSRAQVELQHAPTTAMGLDTLMGAKPTRRRWPLVGLLGLVVVAVGVAMWSTQGSGDDEPLANEPVAEAPARMEPPPTAAVADLPGVDEQGQPEAGSVGETGNGTSGPEPSAVVVAADVTPATADAGPASKGPSRPSATSSGGGGGRDCGRAKKQAREAREHHDWRGVLRYTAAKSCWRSAGEERLTLRTKAAMELGRWDACIATGRRLSGAQPAKWVRTCELRRDRG